MGIEAVIQYSLDYGNTVYDQPNNESLNKIIKLESAQYNAALAITGAIKESSCKKAYRELGLENVKPRRRFRRTCCFYKIKTYSLPSILQS